MRNFIAAFALLISASTAQAAWHEVKTPHFLIYSEQSPQSLQSFANRLERFDKAVRILRNMDDPPVGQSGRVTIFVLDDTDDVSRLATGKLTSIAGFYLPRASGSVAFVPRDTGAEGHYDMSADTIFFHEYAHHMMLQSSDAPYPGWFVEGFAEFFGRANFEKDGSVQLGLPARDRTYGLYVAKKPPIEELLGASFDQKSAEATEAYYARSWLLTHYLAFAPERQGQLTKYMSGIQAGSTPLAAATAAFGDLKTLDREVDSYLRKDRLTYRRVSSPQLVMQPAPVRQLRPGEAAMMPVRMRSARGVDKKGAAEVLALARTRAAPYLNDPAVQLALAEAEFDAGNYAAASAAADRTLAADPQSVKGMIYKGRAEMELAETRSGADWNLVRKWFLNANKVDPEAAEPLMLYYDSFARAGERPTKNAIEGMLYAQVLAPQDDGLRLTAAYILIRTNRPDEARKVLAPLANSPHGSGGRERARKVLAEIAAGKATAPSEAEADDE